MKLEPLTAKPPGVTTSIAGLAPPAPKTVICVGESTLKEVAATPLKVTAVAAGEVRALNDDRAADLPLLGMKAAMVAAPVSP